MFAHSLALTAVLLASPIDVKTRPLRADPDEARPLNWLLHAQNKEGGWGGAVDAPADVATTSLSGIALLRLGQTPVSGEHRDSTRRALMFVVRAVERAPGADEF